MSLKVSVAGATKTAVDDNLPALIADKVASRLFEKDFTLWGREAEAESSIRLGWVSCAADSLELVPKIYELRDKFNAAGVDRFVLCGMGGSSLAPEVITNTAKKNLLILDSTNPEQVAAALAGDLSKTAVVVSSKSGNTVETDSQKRLFEEAFDRAGIDKTQRIVVVTDPGSPMETAAKADGYVVFNADPTVGGRYSALTAFGLVPSGLAGVNIQELLQEAQAVTDLLASDSPSNPALILGAAMARTKKASIACDKLLLVEDGTQIAGLGDWAEQLIAESTGKSNKGVLPIVASSTSPEVQANLDDVVVVRIVASADSSADGEVAVSGSLGAQFLLWECATVFASRLIGINPFDQPDVESAKIAARAMLESREKSTKGGLATHGIDVEASYELTSAIELSTVLNEFLGRVGKDGYISIHAYLDRTNFEQAANLRELFAAKSNRPVTFGWGPRFLHSTGQYHKGGPKQGVYLQLVSTPALEVVVPGRGFTLGELIASQASGDAKVLANLGLPVLTLTFADVEAALKIIESSL